MNGQTPKFEDRTTPPATDWLGVTSFALGMLSLCCCCFFEVGALAGALAIVLACLSRARFGRFSAFAVAGLVCGAFGALFGVAMMIFNLLVYTNADFAASIESLFSGDAQTK